MIYKDKVKKLINNEQIFSKMNTYVRLIETTNEVMNLTGFSKDKLWKEGIFESLICFKNVTFEGRFLDIGAGVGFPSLPLIIVNPKIKLTIIESQTKRINFLKKVAYLLNLKINFINERSENIKNQKFDFITARAVAPLAKLIRISYHLGTKGAIFYLIKGSNITKELDAAKQIINDLKIKIKILKKVLDTKEINIIKYQKDIY